MKTINNQQVQKSLREFDEEDKRLMLLNNKAINMLTCALRQREYFQVSSLETAKEIWETLEIAHKGTIRVKQSRINTLTTEFKLFKMKDRESIQDMEVRFSHLINHFTALGKKYNHEDQVRKILGRLTNE
ncbi:uncharacterized protein LOC114759928 [Neltuma alba]|uniref:uncharacterized protein LOC114749471 n=1 Tax=Neltuma alba TaxID=207710 RepID=UPI0010A453E3|nr:uncharacterized protein LOC114749471 [Prosopis alba]XP_028805001.1 uncharacterized protein LOC114759928 [Prosopis alba]